MRGRAGPDFVLEGLALRALGMVAAFDLSGMEQIMCTLCVVWVPCVPCVRQRV